MQIITEKTTLISKEVTDQLRGLELPISNQIDLKQDGTFDKNLDFDRDLKPFIEDQI